MEGNLMKKLITVSILSAALAASSAFAAPGDGEHGRLAFKNSDGQLQVFVKNNVIRNINMSKAEVQANIAKTLFEIQKHLGAKFISLNVTMNKKDMAEGVLKFNAGKQAVKKITAADLATTAAKINKELRETVVTTQGKIMVFSDVTSEARNAVAAVELSQKKGELILKQVSLAKAQKAVSKLQDADHSGLIAIKASDSDA